METEKNTMDSAAENAVQTESYEPNNESQAADYDELLKADKNLQSWLDKRIGALQKKQDSAIREALEKERKRQQQLAEANLSRAEKEKIMKPEELAEFYRKEADELRNKFARQEEVREFTIEINGILEESKIPAELFNAGLDYYQMSHEEIRERALTFSKYEYYPKGTVEKLVEDKFKAKFNEAVKEKAPQDSAYLGQRPITNPNGVKRIPLVPLEST